MNLSTHSFSKLFITFATVFLQLHFTNAKYAIIEPHDLRMEKFLITRQEFMKKKSNYVLRFFPSGTVIKEEKGSSAEGQWSLAPSSRITFSLMEKGVIESYSAEVLK